MLADNFEGGELVTSNEGGGYETYNLAKGDAAVFVSHKYHNVKPVTSGRRRVRYARS